VRGEILYTRILDITELSRQQLLQNPLFVPLKNLRNLSSCSPKEAFLRYASSGITLKSSHLGIYQANTIPLAFMKSRKVA